MGLLDDAIREHLDLKRRRGADPTEVDQLERDALGPVRRGPQVSDEALPEEEHFDHEEHFEHDEHAQHLDHEEGLEPSGPFVEDEPFADSQAPEQDGSAVLYDDEAPEASSARPAPAPEFADEPRGPREPLQEEHSWSYDSSEVWEEQEVDKPRGPAESVPPAGQTSPAPPREDPAPPPTPARAERPAAPPEPSEGHPDHVGQETVEYDVEAEHEREGGQDDDVLEETPEFLQDTPDHDRLWFEQRPPRPFDFDK